MKPPSLAIAYHFSLVHVLSASWHRLSGVESWSARQDSAPTGTSQHQHRYQPCDIQKHRQPQSQRSSILRKRQRSTAWYCQIQCCQMHNAPAVMGLIEQLRRSFIPLVRFTFVLGAHLPKLLQSAGGGHERRHPGRELPTHVNRRVHGRHGTLSVASRQSGSSQILRRCGDDALKVQVATGAVREGLNAVQIQIARDGSWHRHFC